MIHKVKSNYMAHMIRRWIRYIHNNAENNSDSLEKVFRFVYNKEKEKENDEIPIIYNMDKDYWIACDNIDIINTGLQSITNIYKVDINTVRSYYELYKSQIKDG